MAITLTLALIATALFVVAIHNNVKREKIKQFNHNLIMDRLMKENDLKTGQVFLSKDGNELVVLTHSMVYSQYGSHKTDMGPRNLENAGYTHLGVL